jgi:ribosomal protein L11 methyltransferase
VDIDIEAIRASQENAALNGVTDQLELGIGSVNEVKAGRFTVQSGNLVLANILAPVLVDLLNQGLGDLVLEDGWLVLSGILAEQSLQVEAALADHSFSLVDKLQVGDWVALAAQVCS